MSTKIKIEMNCKQMENVGVHESILIIKNVQESRLGKWGDRLVSGSCFVGSIRVETGLEDTWMSVSREKGGYVHGLRLSPHTLLIPDPCPGRAAITGDGAPWEHVTQTQLCRRQTSPKQGCVWKCCLSSTECSLVRVDT